MRSANNSEEDKALYRRCGCHCVFGKEMPMKDVAEEMKVAYVRLMRRQRDNHLPAPNSLSDVEDPGSEQQDPPSPAISSSSTLRNLLYVEHPVRLRGVRQPKVEQQEEEPHSPHSPECRASSVEPAHAVFHPGQLNNRIFRDLLPDHLLT